MVTEMASPLNLLFLKTSRHHRPHRRLPLSVSLNLMVLWKKRMDGWIDLNGGHFSMKSHFCRAKITKFSETELGQHLVEKSYL